MAFKRKYPIRRRAPVRRKRTTRPKYKRRTRRPLALRNSNPNQLIAPKYITTLKYSDIISPPSSITGLSHNWQFNINSIFDPDRTGTGHQPLGHDQLALLYYRYRVFGVSWRATFFQSANIGSVYAVVANDSTTLANSSYAVMKERPHAFIKSVSTDKPTVITGRVSLPKLNGLTSAQFKANEQTQSLFGTNPSEQFFLNIGGIPAATTAAFPFTVDLVFHVECFDPIPLNQS